MTRIPHTLMVAGVSIFLTIGCHTNTQTTGHYIDDTAITTSVKTHLATDGPLKTMTQISVKTVENIVYLTGVGSDNASQESGGGDHASSGWGSND